MATLSDRVAIHEGVNSESSFSAVSWAAVIGGAFTSVAISLLLLTLGSGLGLSSVSPWAGANPSVTTFTLLAAVWLLIVQWIASGLGGYLTGRLRTKWANLHSDEVFFRDTAHGFLAWAVATVVVVAFLASAGSSIVSGGTRAAGMAAGGVAAGATSQGMNQSSGAIDPSSYYVDSLFRSDRPAGNTSEQEMKTEAARILALGLANDSVPDGDKAYLAQLVSARTGVSQDDARKRVDDVIAKEQAAKQKAREAADQARKAAATGSFYSFFALLVGAFIACVAAALGGRQRDEY
jgi:hypothetical protein